ncbi:MAG: helix-turn-helix domain-containing protein [Segetibacter sp.]|nr:helix-turn-helix domain-containing protein [Segetibacter sp.]
MEIGGNTESTNKSGESSVRQCFSRSEAAYYLGVSVITIDRAVGGRKLACYRIGRRIVFSQTHLDEFLMNNEHKAKDYSKNKKKIGWFSDNQELALAK